MAIEARTDTGNFWDWFNIPGLDGKAIGGAIGSQASIMGGLGATYGGALGLLGWLLSELFPKGGASKPIPNISTDKVLPKDLENQMAWPDAGKMVQELLAGKGNIGTLLDSYSKWLRNEMAWPDAGKMTETLPLGDTGKLDVPAPTMPNYGTATWPNAGQMVETLPEGIAGAISTPATPPNRITNIPNIWPLQELMDRLVIPPLTGNSQLDITKPIVPGTTATPNYGTATWPNAGQMVETLPLGDTGKLDVTAPIIDVRPNTGTTDITDVGTNAGTNEWVSGATNATATWPNEGQMVESIPPYYNDGPKIDWSGPMITDKTNENNEVTINPVTFDSFYDLIRAEQKARWDREDAIRKETQEREDNAWQRAVADMRKAGINPNLVNAGPAESGGGISTATGMNYAMWESGLQKEIALLQQSIDQNFKGDENDKDRFVQLLGNVLSMFSVIAMFKGKI